MRVRGALAAAVLLLVSALPLSAHPHMFFTNHAEFVWDGATLKGVYIEWVFDSFFSADLISGYDVNGDGAFSASETREIYNKAFINLKNYYYFTFIRQGSRRTNPPSVREFSAKQKGGVASYRFFIDLTAMAPGELFLAVYDYTFFCDIRPAEVPVTLTYNPDLVKPRFEIVENKNYPVYYNPLAPPDDTTIYYEYRKGLKTYYPKEIRITYDK